MGLDVIAGKYELGKTLGRGRFSKVKIATNLETGEQVAVKITERDKQSDAVWEEQLRREIAVLRKLRHPYVVQLLDVFTTPKTYYLVLELVTGGELLDKIVESRRFEEHVARYYFQQLILGLYFVHKNGVAHRDLKPENLLLDATGYLKISDFGFSKQQDPANFNPNMSILGTPEYLAPDVISGYGYDGFKADIWSCGVILYVMCSGSLPFGNRFRVGDEVYQHIRTGSFQMKEYFSPELKDLLSHILVVDPNARYTLEDIVRHPWMQPMPEAELEYVRQFNPYVASPAEVAQAFTPSSESAPTTPHWDSQQYQQPYSPDEASPQGQSYQAQQSYPQDQSFAQSRSYAQQPQEPYQQPPYPYADPEPQYEPLPETSSFAVPSSEPVEMLHNIVAHRSFEFPTFVEKPSNMRFGVQGQPNDVVPQVLRALAFLNANPDNSKSYYRIKARVDEPGGDVVAFNITVSDRGGGISGLDVRRRRGSTLSFHQIYRDLLSQLAGAGQHVYSGAGLLSY